MNLIKDAGCGAAAAGATDATAWLPAKIEDEEARDV